MAKPVPGSNNLQAAIDNAFATMQRAIKGQSNEICCTVSFDSHLSAYALRCGSG